MGRGCRGEPVLSTDVDREHFCFLLGDVVDRFGWTVGNWTLMPNHHHLLIKLEEPNLDAGMHRLHGLFAQRWNIRNDNTGHVFFRRYKSIPLTRTGAAGRVAKYVDLNPVRAGLCDRPEDWEWGGYGAIVGRRRALRLHAAEAGLQLLGGDHADSAAMQFEYARAVRERLATTRAHGVAARSRPLLPEIIVRGDIDSLREAHETWWYSTRAIATYLDVSVATVHRWLKEAPIKRTGAALTRWQGAS